MQIVTIDKLSREFGAEEQLLAFGKEIDKRFVELESIAGSIDAKLQERAAELDARNDMVEKVLKNRTMELDAREIRLNERRDAVLHALAVESDKNFAALEERRAEIEATALKNDAKIQEIGDELDKREAEVKKREAELDQREADLRKRAAELDEREGPSNRKRQRAVDFSLVTQMADELKKIFGGDLDDHTKEELKQRMFAMLERAD